VRIVDDVVAAEAPGVAHERVIIRDSAAGGGTSHTTTWGIAVEQPVELTINGEPWMVILASPTDLDDLAIGLGVTERVVADASAILDVVITTRSSDVSVNLVVPPTALDRRGMITRAMASGSACGLCGVESMDQVRVRAGDLKVSRSGATVVRGKEPISDAAIIAAFAALPAYQPINRATHSAHAAAWCNADGDMVLAREDVGRHSALDKLVGAMSRSGLPVPPGFVVMSSRCSFELVAKASALNPSLLATISAPTTMALEWSRTLGIPLACRIGGADDGRIVRFNAEGEGAS
jgi:FdhD protein